VVVYSVDFDEIGQFSTEELPPDTPHAGSWLEYVKGVAWALGEAEYVLRGWDGVIVGDVPVGAGLSSSAAIEMATARAFAASSGFEWQPAAMALVGQRAENAWVGVNSGIMDQMISAAGVTGRALLIDCRSLETRAVPLPQGSVIVIMDTATRRELMASAYNERRAQCEEAAAFFRVPALRDVGLDRFEHEGHALPDGVRKRARHVITENDRTLRAAEAMRAGDAPLLGRLMNESHTSLRDDFEVTNNALNVIVEIAQAQPTCYGARMTGAGFGGCAVALVPEADAPAFAAAVAVQYSARTGRDPAVYITYASEGASLLAGEST
jgi:galactokinase